MLEHTHCCLNVRTFFLLRQVGTIEEACELFPKADVLINFARWVLARFNMPGGCCVWAAVCAAEPPH